MHNAHAQFPGHMTSLTVFIRSDHLADSPDPVFQEFPNPFQIFVSPAVSEIVNNHQKQ